MEATDTRLTPNSLTIFDVRQLEDTLQACLNNNRRLSVDLQQLSEFDAAGVQWLMSLELRSLLQEHRVELLDPSAFCLEQLNLIGFKELMGAANA